MGRKQYTEQQKKDLARSWMDGNLTLRDFCSINNVTAQSLYRWKDQYFGSSPVKLKNKQESNHIISNHIIPKTLVVDFEENKKRYEAGIPPGGNFISIPENIYREIIKFLATKKYKNKFLQENYLEKLKSFRRGL